jgi:N-acetyl-1-D-myo-inositol-2-amino-2-deoxy-alpha-D-glucopyranoside deacetylase
LAASSTSGPAGGTDTDFEPETEPGMTLGEAAGLRVLGVFAHPDDEAFAAGGLLALAAASGAHVIIACATRGESGVLQGAASYVGQTVAEVRAAELAASCRALGADEPWLLDLPDGGLAAMDAAAGQACVARVLDHVQPDLVVTLGIDGVYGHTDHLACTAWVRAAVAAMPLEARPRLLLAAFPRGMFVPVWQRLRRVAGVPIAPEIDAATLGVPASGIDIRLDVRPVAAQKRAALAAHRSQLPGGDPMRFLAPALPRTAVAQLLDEEWYVHADGPALPAGSTEVLAGLAR